MSEQIETITRDPDLSVADLFEDVKAEDSGIEDVVVGKSPLERMSEKPMGMVITPTNSDGEKIAGGPGPNHKLSENVEKTLDEMDHMIQKAQAITIVNKPKNDIEMATMMDALDKLTDDDIKKIQAAQNENAVNVVKEESLMGADINADTVVVEEGGVVAGSNFVARVERPKGEETSTHGNVKPSEPSGSMATNQATPVSGGVQVIVDKIGEEDESRIISFTDEERKYLTESNLIELVKVQKLDINVGAVKKPTEEFMSSYINGMHASLSGSVNMTFTASRFRGTIRGMTFGEFVDIALSSETTDVDRVNKRLSVIYNILSNVSVRPFIDYDDFLRRFAYKDVDLAVYAAYITTNPEILTTNLRCGREECGARFEVSYRPRNLLIMERLSDYYKEIMQKVATIGGEEAQKFHEESGVQKRVILELPNTQIGVEVGFRSAYEMINKVLPYDNTLRATYTERYPDDVNRVRQIIGYVNNYISALYFKDENGEYTIREDDVFNITEVMCNLPVGDYSIILAMMTQIDSDYNVIFGIRNVTCPKCKEKTEIVTLDLNREVFQSFQELGTTSIDTKTLPRF